MKLKLLLIFCGIGISLVFAISSIIKYNSLLSEKSLYAITGTQENYSWSIAKFSIQLSEFYALVRSDTKDIDKIKQKLDILFSRVSVIRDESESTIPLYKEKDYKKTIDSIYTKLEVVDAYMQKPSPDMTKVVDLVNEMEPDSKLLVNLADHAEVRQRTSANLDFKKNKNQLLILLYITGALAIALGIIVSFSLWKTNKLLDSEKKAFNNKNAFLGIVGHELRTSLQAIISSIDVLVNNKGNRLSEQQISRLENSAVKMEMQMKDLSEFAKIDNGNVEINEASFNLRRLMDESIDECVSMLNKVEVVVIKGDFPDVVIKSDPSRMMQIVENLVTNAIKYTESGSVTISSDIDSKSFVSIRVEDTGQGIPRNKIKSIFSPFVRMQGTQGVPGFGMGLAIVNGIVKAMKGNIQVKSEVSIGSTFTVRLPVLVTNEQFDVNNDSYLYEPIHNHLRLLLVDDNEMSCASLVSILESAEYKVEYTNSSERALEKLLRKPYDLVLSDLQMPMMTGDELFNKLRSHDGPNKNVPFIFISAYASDSPIAYVPILTKPVRIREINKEINKVMST